MAYVAAEKRSVLGKVPSNYAVKRSKFLAKLKISDNGLYTRRALKKNDIIGQYRGIKLSKSQALAKKSHRNYLFDVKVNGKVSHVIDAANKHRSSFTRYVNAPSYLHQQNTKFVQHNKKIYLKAMKDIRAGSELLAWYGKNTKDVIIQT